MMTIGAGDRKTPASSAPDVLGDGLKTEVRRLDGTVVVAVHGDVDLASAPELWATVEGAVSAGDRLVLDVSNVAFIDSSGLAVLIRASQILGDSDSLVVR